MKGLQSSPQARPYAVYAGAFLAATVLAGVWMRAMLVWPEAALGASFAYARHAHSHLALFGWVTPALFAAILYARPAGDPGLDSRHHHWLPHLLGAVTVLTFVSFLVGGYDVRSIALSAAHVALWVLFVTVLRRSPAGDRSPSALWFQVATWFLLVAGAATIAPVVNIVAGVTSGWTRELAVKLFLALFIGGWVVIGSIGVLYRVIAEPRFHRPALVLAAAGVPFTVFMHVTAAYPAGWEWLMLPGRLGTAAVGAAMLLVAADGARSVRDRPLVGLAVLALAAKGALELLVAAGVGLPLLRSPAVAVAYLHLVFLGLVTPLLLTALSPMRMAFGRTVALAAGAATMLLPVAALGWPWLLGVAMDAGLTVGALRILALAGGAVAAAATIALAAAVTWPLLQASPTLKRARQLARSRPPAIRPAGILPDSTDTVGSTINR
jgi:hypothetical protein